MTDPKQLHRVEWEIARLHDTPHDRRERSRIFTSAHTAAQQVRAVMVWVPSHAELHGVWRTCGYEDGELRWEQVDPETGLPALLPHVEARYAALERVAKGGALPADVVEALTSIDDNE